MSIARTPITSLRSRRPRIIAHYGFLPFRASQEARLLLQGHLVSLRRCRREWAERISTSNWGRRKIRVDVEVYELARTQAAIHPSSQAASCQ
jgi:hypothetical protein